MGGRLTGEPGCRCVRLSDGRDAWRDGHDVVVINGPVSVAGRVRGDLVVVNGEAEDLTTATE